MVLNDSGEKFGFSVAVEPHKIKVRSGVEHRRNLNKIFAREPEGRKLTVINSEGEPVMNVKAHHDRTITGMSIKDDSTGKIFPAALKALKRINNLAAELREALTGKPRGDKLNPEFFDIQA